MNHPASTATFTGLVDLASEGLGGRALGASDEFFAEAQNMLKEGRGVFVPDRFTDRGKWMDGWESRRKRTPGHDWCTIELGAPGTVLGFDIDTNHFIGNHPQFASVEGLVAPAGSSFEELERAPVRELLDQVPLAPGAQNLFVARASEPVTHVRLRIYPDGGVARFRVYGRVTPARGPSALDEETTKHVAPELIDLAAVKNGGVALACSDARFGPMNNLLLPGRAVHMGGGWETRRSRQGGHDWILIALSERGVPRVVEVDTNHFKGNYPDRFSLELIDRRGARVTELVASEEYRVLLGQTKLQAHTRHFYALQDEIPGTHVRLNIFPDGGVSRLRVWGLPLE